MNNYEFTNRNRNQNSLEVDLTHMLCLSGEGDLLIELNFAEWAKIDEEDPETIPTKGTRHPSTRAERRKKTAHAKQRKVETIRTRETRKFPYSQMLGNGKKHDHIWIDEDSIVETRQKVKAKSELRDFYSRDLWYENYIDNYDIYVEEGEDHQVYDEIHHLENELSKRDEYIRFLESRIRDLEKEIGF